MLLISVNLSFWKGNEISSRIVNGFIQELLMVYPFNLWKTLEDAKEEFGNR